ncbi:hypothetical protein EW145_g3608 [Phellinidium pouzarii]|uniref:Cysteine-rich protein n=1 Tax=Phellinidium pouzarii TaxID=167371 RepID=A0A4S4L8F7_9AGAM|nr:hypothetical protein EW145_g3608 [Phellinidium pouzarii]
MRASLIALAAVSAAFPAVLGGPLAYGVCQTGCNVAAGTCYAAAGFTFGTVLVATAPASIMACNALLGSCMVACAGMAIAPTL